MAKHKKNLDFVYDNIKINAGIVGGTAVVGKIGNIMHSPQSNNIMKGMETMKIVPTIHATGGIFGQLNDLNKMVKKKKR